MPVGLGVPVFSQTGLFCLTKITVLLERVRADFCHLPPQGTVPRDSFPHYFNPLFTFNLFSRAVSTTVAHCQERKSRHSWMAGTKPVQLPTRYYFHMPFSSVWLNFGKDFQLNAACRARFTLAEVPAFLCIHTRRPENTLHKQLLGVQKRSRLYQRVS